MWLAWNDIRVSDGYGIYVNKLKMRSILDNNIYQRGSKNTNAAIYAGICSNAIVGDNHIESSSQGVVLVDSLIVTAL